MASKNNLNAIAEAGEAEEADIIDEDNEDEIFPDAEQFEEIKKEETNIEKGTKESGKEKVTPLMVLNTEKGKKAKPLPQDVEDAGAKATVERKRMRSEHKLGPKLKGSLEGDGNSIFLIFHR